MNLGKFGIGRSKRRMETILLIQAEALHVWEFGADDGHHGVHSVWTQHRSSGGDLVDEQDVTTLANELHAEGWLKFGHTPWIGDSSRRQVLITEAGSRILADRLRRTSAAAILGEDS